jgi:hypothetical protein
MIAIYSFVVGVVVGILAYMYWGKINSVSDIKAVVKDAKDKVDAVKDEVKK